MGEGHARPGKSFIEMLELILENQRRPNDPFSPQLLMAIFWEEGPFFTNQKQRNGTAIGFGQTEPAEFWTLTTQHARNHGYEVPGVSTRTRQLSDALAVTVASCMLLRVFHTRTEPTTEGKVAAALRAYGGVSSTVPSSLTPEQRLAKIAGWRACERDLKKLPFSVYTIVNFPGKLTDLEEAYMAALQKAKGFNPNFAFTKPPAGRFRDLLFPRNWFMGGLGEEHFLVVAGPGDNLRTVARGDVLIRQPRNGGTPHVARVRSPMAEAEDFLLEGVAAERGAPGLYVEVDSPGAPPIARLVVDRHGRVADGTVVVRPTPHATVPSESFDETSAAELQRQRDALIARIDASDLFWHDIPLAGGYHIRVSSPILKDGFFVPVTARETLQLARRFEVFPLTRAVMDQTHNAAIKLAFPGPPSTLFDFVGYTNRLKTTPYYTQFGYALASGAHKLWVISSAGPVINYGLYIARSPRDPVRCGPRLDTRYNVIQSLGGRHNASHWDYSQLLQFMSRLEDANGEAVDLRQALLNRHPAVWDEARPPAAGSLP